MLPRLNRGKKIICNFFLNFSVVDSIFIDFRIRYSLEMNPPSFHAHSMDSLEEVPYPFAYRFQKWQQPEELWQDEILEHEVCICNFLFALKLKTGIFHLQFFSIFSHLILFFYNIIIISTNSITQRGGKKLRSFEK